MSKNKGGMQTAATNCSIYCPKCQKPAARMEKSGNVERYLHFTKKGAVWHKVVIEKTIYCNPDVCDHCMYIGEGDSWCDVTQEIVLENWVPTDAFMGKGCVVLEGGAGNG